VCVCVCVCLCVCGERERERMCVCVFVCEERESVKSYRSLLPSDFSPLRYIWSERQEKAGRKGERERECVCERERETECVCVCGERERERETESVKLHCALLPSDSSSRVRFDTFGLQMDQSSMGWLR